MSTAGGLSTTIWEAAALGRATDIQRHLTLLADRGARHPADARDAGGWTPLLHAAFQGRASASQWLVTHGGANPDARDTSSLRRTPLLEATASGSLRVVRVLLAFGSAVDVDAQDTRGCSALMLAAWRGHADVTRELLAAGARVDLRDRDKWTALAFAARFGRLEIARLLLAHDAQRDAASSAREHTPLMHAVLTGQIEVACTLLDAGADVFRVDRDGNSLAMMALEGDVQPSNGDEETARLEMLRLLLERGVQLLDPNKSGRTSMQVAVEEGFTRVARLLGPNKSGRTPMQVAVEEGLSRVAEFLSQCQPLEEKTNDALDGDAAFFDAVRTGDLPLVLSRVDAMLHARDADGRTPLLLAAMHDQLDVLQVCLSRGANVSNRDDSTASSALHFAARVGSPRAVTLLLNEGADASMKDAQGLTPMDVAAAFGHVEVVEELYAGGASVRNVSKIDRQTIWHRAVSGNCIDIVRYLAGLAQRCSDDLNAPPDVNALNRNGYSALHIAASAGLTAIVALLLAVGADPNCLSNAVDAKSAATSRSTVRESEEEPKPEDTTAEDKAVADGEQLSGARHESALHLAVAGGHGDVVALLLRRAGNSEGCARVDIRDYCLRTPLLIAVALGYSDIAVQLLDAGADIEAVAHGPASGDDAGRTPLLLASLHGHEQLVKTLLEYGARVDVTSANGETPIGVATTQELGSVLELYLSSQEFHQRCFTLLHGGEDDPSSDEVDGSNDAEQTIAVSSDELLELAGLVTSAYDLRFLMTISLHILDDASAKNQPTAAAEVAVSAALKRAFELILAKKLVYDNNAFVFFRLALEQCSKRGLVASRDFVSWKLEATKVNMESADWVVDLKRQVYENSWRAQTCAKNVELLAHGIKHVHAMTVANRDGMLACVHKVRSLEDRLQDANRVMATAMTHMQAAIMTNAADIRDNRERLTSVDGKLLQLHDRLKMNEANVQEVATHLQTMQRAQLANMQRQRKHEMVKHGFGLVASLVGFVFAPMLKEVFDTVLDLSDPLEIAKCAFSDALGGGDGLGAGNIVDFLLAAGGGGGDEAGSCSSALQPMVETLLAKFGISGDEFTTVLREEIILQHPELVESREDLVVMGTTDSDGLHDVLAQLESQESDLSSMLDEMREYTQRISAMERAAVPLSPCPSPMLSSGLKPSKLSESDVASLPPLDGGFVTAYAVAVPVMVLETNQLPLVDESISVDMKTSSDDSTAVEDPMVNTPSSKPSEGPSEGPSGDYLDAILATEEVEEAIELAEDVSQFPFHLAVVRSGGDLTTFQDAINSTSGLDDYDPNASMAMDAVVYATATRTTLSAAEYAYCLGYEAVGDLLSGMMAHDEAPTDRPLQARTASVSVEIEENLDDFPYHYAVSETCGDVEECELFLEVAHQDGVPIDTRVHARVHREIRRSRTPMSAVELASRLGYVGVVRHFVVVLGVKTAIKGVVLLNRASKQAKKMLKAPRVVIPSSVSV